VYTIGIAPMPRIAEVRVEPLDVELTEPFGIATGAQLRAENGLVTIVLDDGCIGLGEAAPFPAVSAETRDAAIAAVVGVRASLIGADPRRWRRVARALAESIPQAASARCALETALLDALCTSAGLSLWAFFGGAEQELQTDITIPTGDVAHALASATRALDAGFDTLKVKIGAGSIDDDARRIRAIAELSPVPRLVLDANASLTADGALALLSALGAQRARVALFEQPTARCDLEGMARVRRDARISVAADESACSAADVARIARAGAADVVNLKITKSGIAETLEMAAAARALGLGLMIGGNVETRLAMTASACLAAGLGGFGFVDLDTPMFLVEDPFEGGFLQSGPRLSLASIERGHGVRKSIRGR
jgi:L-Ala-D/L-Glu epimerase